MGGGGGGCGGEEFGGGGVGGREKMVVDILGVCQDERLLRFPRR